MRNINADIKNKTFKHAYLLYGEEGYLRKQYKDRLKDALSSGDMMNCHYFSESGVDVNEIISLAQTMPFLAERRVIVISNSGLFQSGGDALAEYMKDIAPTAYFVFAEEKVDKRTRLFKAVSNIGYATECKAQDMNTLRKWVLGIVAKENKIMSASDVNLFLEKTGTDMTTIRNELEKLISYCLDKPAIEAKDIEVLCTQTLEARVFEMLEAIAAKNQKKALELYNGLLFSKESPLGILALLERQFNLLYQVKHYVRDRCPTRVIAERTGLRDFLVNKYASGASHFTERDLRTALDECVRMEESIKTGKMNDKMGIELLIVKYSS